MKLICFARSCCDVNVGNIKGYNDVFLIVRKIIALLMMMILMMMMMHMMTTTMTMILLFLLFPLLPMPQVHIVVDIWLAQLAVELQDVLIQLLQLLMVVGWQHGLAMLLLWHLKAMRTKIMEIIPSIHLNPPAHLEFTLTIPFSAKK